MRWRGQGVVRLDSNCSLDLLPLLEGRQSLYIAKAKCLELARETSY